MCCENLEETLADKFLRPDQNHVQNTKWWDSDQRTIFSTIWGGNFTNGVPREWDSRNLPWEVPNYSFANCPAASPEHCMEKQEKDSLGECQGRPKLYPQRYTSTWGIGVLMSLCGPYILHVEEKVNQPLKGALLIWALVNSVWNPV